MTSNSLIAIIFAHVFSGHALQLTRMTGKVIRVPENRDLIIDVRVASSERPLLVWFGPGNRILNIIDRHVTISLEKNVIRLHISNANIFRSGMYYLRGVDSWDLEKLDFKVIVEVVVFQHIGTEAVSHLYVNQENPELSCKANYYDDVTWEHCGCNVTIRRTQGKIITQFNKCAELSALDFVERQKRLEEAALLNDVITVSTLLLLGAGNRELGQLRNPLRRAVEGGHVEVTKLLFNAGATLDNIDIFHPAIATSVGVVAELLDRGTNANSVDNSRRTLLMYAAWWGDHHMVQSLVERGANMDVDDYGRAALFYAAWHGSEQIVQYLISRGMNPSAKSWLGLTSLMIAARLGNLPLTDVLLAAKADPQAMNVRGYTALHIAAMFGAPLDVVKLLVKMGANLTAVTSEGHTAVDIAQFYKNQQILSYLSKL
ncbi:ankyrin homolog [Periplaneta americana]|uniref:ankyrin homolog n=1 Tax=Periplaneta americana TaxID=6978 RepID=UPI0037E76820